MDRALSHRSRRFGAKLLGFAVKVLALATPLVITLSALAAADEESKSYDARLERYPANVTLDSGGTALTWVLFLILTGMCVGVLLKNANRSHLD